jgi:hypothetical protein
MTRIPICALMLALTGTPVGAAPAEETILALERQAMDLWRQGNPDGFLAISDPGITFFHSTVEAQLVGLAAVKTLYEGYRGRPLFDRYEMAEPRVVAAGGTAVLTYVLVTWNGSLTRRWHASEVYRDGRDGWRIVHSHFSAVNP